MDRLARNVEQYLSVVKGKGVYVSFKLLLCVLMQIHKKGYHISQSTIKSHSRALIDIYQTQAHRLHHECNQLCISNEAGSDLDLIHIEVGSKVVQEFDEYMWLYHDLTSCGVNEGKKGAYHRDQNIDS